MKIFSRLLIACSTTVVAAGPIAAQAPRTSADSLAVIVAAVKYARHDLLFPQNRPVLVLEKHPSRQPWAQTTALLLARTLTDGDSAARGEAVGCVNASPACTVGPLTDLITVSDVVTEGDTSFVTVSVARAGRQAGASVAWRAREYALIRRGDMWVVDHVRTTSAI